MPFTWLDLGGDVQAPGEYWGAASFLPKHKGVDVHTRPWPRQPGSRQEKRSDRMPAEICHASYRSPDGANRGPVLVSIVLRARTALDYRSNGRC